jgi:hypothetical protein
LSGSPLAVAAHRCSRVQYTVDRKDRLVVSAGAPFVGHTTTSGEGKSHFNAQLIAIAMELISHRRGQGAQKDLRLKVLAAVCRRGP